MGATTSGTARSARRRCGGRAGRATAALRHTRRLTQRGRYGGQLRGPRPRRPRCAARAPPASSTPSPSATRCWPACSTPPASPRAAATGRAGGSSSSRTPPARVALRDLYLAGWYEYLAMGAAGLVPWAPVTDRAAEAARPLADAAQFAEAGAAAPGLRRDARHGARPPARPGRPAPRSPPSTATCPATPSSAAPPSTPSCGACCWPPAPRAWAAS